MYGIFAFVTDNSGIRRLSDTPVVTVPTVFLAEKYVTALNRVVGHWEDEHGCIYPPVGSTYYMYDDVPAQS